MSPIWVSRISHYDNRKVIYLCSRVSPISHYDNRKVTYLFESPPFLIMTIGRWPSPLSGTLSLPVIKWRSFFLWSCCMPCTSAQNALTERWFTWYPSSYVVDFSRALKSWNGYNWINIKLGDWQHFCRTYSESCDILKDKTIFSNANKVIN